MSGMRFIVTAVTVALIAASVLSMGIVNERNTRSSLTKEIQGRLLLQVRNLAYLSTDALLADYPELTLQPLVNEISLEMPELAFVVVTDHAGIIKGHSDPRMLGQRYVYPLVLASVDTQGRLRPRERLESNSELVIAVASATYEKGQVIGTAIAGLPRGYLADRLASARRSQLLLVGILLLVGSLSALLVMSMLLRPIGLIVKGLGRIGQGDLETTIEIRDRTELGALAQHINKTTAELKHAQIEMVQRERLSHEMELARQIQKSLLPASEMNIGPYTILGDQASALEVGGDYYDVFEIDGGKAGLVIADVAGKGLAGCLATSMLAAYLRAYRESALSPAELLYKLDVQLAKSLPRGTFVTMFYAILDLDGGELIFSSAGHLPTLIYRHERQAIEWLYGKGIPLAMVRDGCRFDRADQSTTLNPGDLLVQMTDGINEAWNEDRTAQFSLENVAKVVKAAGRSGSRTVMSALRTAVETWTGDQSRSDDETLLVVQRQAVPSEMPDDEVKEDEPSDLCPERCLVEAKAEGSGLRLTPDLDAVSAIQGWLAGCPVMKDLSQEELGIVNAALVDTCANIIEHSGHSGPDGDIELYWHHEKDDVNLSYDPEGAVYDREIWQASRVVKGCFVICDRGKPFDPRNCSPTNMEEFKRSGRGMGLNIINTAMWRIWYEPGTLHGNITVMQYHPVKHWRKEEVLNG